MAFVESNGGAMHIIISWDIKNCEKDEWNELNEKLRECIDDYSWVKPLTTFYIIKLNSEGERKTIRESIVNVCKANKGKLNVVISPVICEGTYSGWLPHSMWDLIKERTNEDDSNE